MSSNGNDNVFGPGDIVGGCYRIIQFIGKGAMGKVYRAQHEMMPRQYALKTLNENQVNEATWRRFQVEAQSIARMNHPNVVVIYNLGFHDGYLPFYVMDLLEGESLFNRLNRVQTMTVAEALPIFIQVADGLGYGHKKGIVHRDIKPDNIFLLQEPDAAGVTVKIVDFGIAKLSDANDPKNQELTKVGEVFGTPFYMSPEQCMGMRVDGRSDIYSLGCALFETLSGTPPFRGANSMETMLMHQNDLPPTLEKASHGDKFPEAVETMLAKALAKEPMDRYQSMEAFKQDMELILQGKDLSVVPYLNLNRRTGAQTIPGGNTQNFTRTGGDGSNDTVFLDRSATGQGATRGFARTTGGGTQAPFIDDGTGSYNSQSETGAQVENERKQNVALKIGLALAGVFLLTGAGVGIYYATRPAKPLLKVSGDQRRESLELPLSNDGKRGKGTADSALAFIANETPEKLNQKGFFSKKVMQEGELKRQFSFPIDCTIGTLVPLHEPSLPYSSVTAQNGYLYPATSKLVFRPYADLYKHPEYFKHFREDDCVGLNLSECPTLAALETYLKFPGITEIYFDRSKKIELSWLKRLSEHSRLTGVMVDRSSADGGDMVCLTRLPRLQTLSFVAGKDAQALTSALRNNSTIKYLDLSECKLNSADYANIATLRNLETLFINENEIKKSDLRVLTALRNLKEFHVRPHRMEENAGEIFLAYPNLKKLFVGVTKSEIDICNYLQEHKPAIKSRANQYVPVGTQSALFKEELARSRKLQDEMSPIE